MTEFSSLGAQTEFMLYGLALVMGVLTLLWGVCNLNYLIAKLVAGKKPNTTPNMPKLQAAPMADMQATAVGPETRLVAILAAAATEALGQSVRIVRFNPVHTSDATWVIQGRASHHSSHQKN